MVASFAVERAVRRNEKPPQRGLSPLWWFLLEGWWKGVEDGSRGVGGAVA